MNWQHVNAFWAVLAATVLLSALGAVCAFGTEGEYRLRNIAAGIAALAFLALAISGAFATGLPT
jgi:lysylphosphatidylglycerol synthetase-like protein (DUF2156 family)